MGKNRVQKKEKHKNKPKQNNIYNKKHVRITLMKHAKSMSLEQKDPPNNNSDK